MSRIVTIHCDVCDKDKEEHIGTATPTTCSDCKETERKEKKKVHLANLDTMSSEERLRKLEEAEWERQNSKPLPFNMKL